MAGRHPERVRQFASARACARRAQAGLGLPPAPLLRGPGGAPAWSPGVVGSITHCGGYRGAAVARSTALAALGIDAEPALPLPTGVLGLVGTDEEGPMIADLTATRPDVPWDRLLFSAKEAVYKAWYPRSGQWLGFSRATVRLDPDGGFTARLRPERPAPGVPLRYTGRWLTGRGLLLTAVAVPAVSAVPPARS
ncbi:4'-phosphopantetheinyl transferase family protein [Streptomyces otsuchiensis]|uniref:4'-phosphopantetheinyl transferase family protein n=1 Tax=Streptomyces otsuchiensis TaxID=2681388 RepID=UPI003F68A341